MKEIKRRDFIRNLSLLPAGVIALNDNNHLKYQSQSKSGDLYDPWIEINLKNMEWNINQISKMVNNRPILAVIKGNAYGHGLTGVGKFLEKINIHGVAVGKLSEALELRNEGIRFQILNFGPFSKDDSELIVGNEICQTVYFDNVLYLNERAEKLNKKAKVQINIDTGMGRVGVPYYEALAFIEQAAGLKNVRIEGVFTALTEDKEFDRIQVKRLVDISNKAKAKGISTGPLHATSSAGLLNFPESYLDMVRPGISVYGHYPSDEEYKLKRIELRPVMSLKTRVSYIKKLRPGDSISYHKLFTAEKEETVVTASLGYSDGFPYNVAGKAIALINGKKFPLIAAVTANHISIKVTGEKDIKIGDEVVLIGKQGTAEITAEEVAAAANTSVYKIVIMMNPLLPRIFKG